MEEVPSKQASPKRTLGRPVGVITRTVLVFFISQLVGLFAVSGIYDLLSPHHPPINDSIVAQFFYILVAEGLAAGLAIRMVRSRGLGLSVIGLGRRPKVNDLWRAAIAFVAFYALLIAAGVILSLFSPDINNEQQNLGFTNIDTGWENILAFISLVIIPPLGEETLVRGYLFSGLRKAWRLWPAVLVTSLIFGAAHLELGSLSLP
ncbi:CPBP family intramembrane metalloprotease, partial [Candidatus Saccharibacteria bacterium]|nr:CPBP family intramembrane metalloprotease [Candidatus Saccharibacteria bacterium]